MASPFRSALLAVVVATVSVRAGTQTLTSSDFSLGYGFVPRSEQSGEWSAEETENSNVFPAENFGITIEVEGGQLSTTGPSFVDRQLSSMSASNASALVSNFRVMVSGSYNGPKPANAAADPKYRVKVNVKRISIYVAPSVPNMADTINFSETTYENDQSQDPEEITSSATFATLSAWRKLEWLPPKSEGQARIFEFNQTGDGNPFAIDGLEVEGNVEVTYDTK